MRKLYRAHIGALAIIFGLLLSIFIAGQTFLQPRAPFASYENDRLIALIYLLAFLFAGLLALFNVRRALLFFASALATGLLLVAIRHSPFTLLLWLWILWLSWGLGKQLYLRSAPPDEISALEADVLSLALGWGALMVLVLILGVIGLYQRVAFYVFLGMLSGILFFKSHQATPFVPQARRCATAKTQSLKSFSSHLCDFVANPTLADSLTLFTVVLLAAGSFLWALAPAVRYDALSYHLAVPMRYLAAGRMLELPESFQTYSAHYGEMLYTLALGLGEQPLPALLNFTAGLLLAAQTYFIGRRLGGHRAAMIAALLLYSLPIIGIESATAYADIFVAVFVTAAMQIFLRWRENPDHRDLLLMGIFSGLALGTKLNALFLLLPFWVWVFFNAKAQRAQRFFAISWRTLSLRGSLLFIPLIVLWLPWLLRDFIWTGNPIFPNYNQLFHSPDWFVAPFFRIQTTGGIATRMLAFPWWGVTDSYRYYYEAPGAVLGALPLLGLPWLYEWRKHKGFFLVFIAALVMIFAYGGSARYLMPLFPLLSALAALNVEKLFLNANNANERMTRINLKENSRYSFIRAIRVKTQSTKTAHVLFLLLGLSYIFSTRLAFTARWWEIPERYPVGIWLGTETQAEFIERIVPVYGAFEYLDALGQFKVFSIGNELRLYTDSQIYAPLFSKEAREILHTSATPAALAEKLAQNDYDYLLYYAPEAEFRPEVYASPALSEEFLRLFTAQVYAQREVYLYALDFTNEN